MKNIFNWIVELLVLVIITYFIPEIELIITSFNKTNYATIVSLIPIIIFITYIYIIKYKNIKLIANLNTVLLISWSILLIYTILGYGSGLLLLYNIFLILYIFFFYIGYNNNYNKILILIYTLIQISIILFSINITNINELDIELNRILYDSAGDPHEQIYFWPYIWQLYTISFLIFTNKYNFKFKNILIIIFTISQLLFIFSPFSSVFLLQFLFFVFLYHFEYKPRIKQTIIIGIVVTIVVSLYLIIPNTVLPFEFSMNDLTNGRQSLNQYAFDGIEKNPFYGNGLYIFSDNNLFSRHSFLFDTLSAFGMLGLPFLLVYVHMILVGEKLQKKLAAIKNSSLNFEINISKSLLLALLIMSPYNAYFMTHIGFILFLLYGSIISRYVSIKTEFVSLHYNASIQC